LNYRWTFKKEADESTVLNISESLNIPKSLAKVLTTRGVTSIEDARKFFEPKKADIHDPFLMDGMDIATERIIRAVDKGEPIWIHGDYDVDGTTSIALLMQFLQEIGGTVNFYIPDRFTEGYGLSKASIDKSLKAKTKLVITVDVGITSNIAVAYAKEKNLDVIVCDHHEPGDELPVADVIIDAIKGTCNYPFKHLAACGVVFKVVQAIAQTIKWKGDVYKYLDYVAIASAADMVPLIGENRTLVYFGLKQLNEDPRSGLKGLIDCIPSITLGSITASSIVYSLAPLINAAGRLGDAGRAVNMMVQGDSIVAFQVAQQLEQENRRRRHFDEITFEEAIPMADELLKEKSRRSLVIHSPHWHAGVIGIVASRLVDRYRLPTVLMTSIDGKAKGSARSTANFDIHSAMKKCSHLMIEFGGHKHAAGLTMPEEHVEELRRSIDETARTQISKEMLEPDITIDAELKLWELSPDFLKCLEGFAPHGYENYKPVFVSRGVRSLNGVKIVGKNHLKFRAYQRFEIDAIGYNLGHKLSECSGGKSFSIVYNIEENVFGGRSTPQLRIKDVRADEE
jgi:single-stranded-DNA-specific exonuclease